MASFNSIDDDCIRLILIRFPLSRYGRMRYRLVCHRWKSLIDSQCLQERSLRLKDQFHYLEKIKYGIPMRYYRFNDSPIDRPVEFHSFPSEYFTEKFINVQDLYIRIRRSDDLIQPFLVSVLGCWTETLTHLTLDRMPIPLDLMLPHLASLTKLTKLQFFIGEKTDFTRFTNEFVLKSVKFMSLKVCIRGNLFPIIKQICGVISTTFPSLDELIVTVHSRYTDIDELNEIARKVTFCKVKVEFDPGEVEMYKVMLQKMRERSRLYDLQNSKVSIRSRFGAWLNSKVSLIGNWMENLK